MIKSATSKTLLQAPKLHGLYCLDNELAKNEAYQSLTAIEVHKKLGHISHKALRHLLKHGLIQGIELNSIGDKITCNACIKSKIICKPLPKDSGERAKNWVKKYILMSEGHLDILQLIKSRIMFHLLMTTQENQ